MLTLCGALQFICAFSFPTSHILDEDTEAQRKEQLTQSQPQSSSKSQVGGFGFACGLETWDHLSLLPKLWPLGLTGNVLARPLPVSRLW